MKNKLSSVRAFSLVELSIVILIVGIIIVGVTQSSRLVKVSRLQTARTLTQSSALAGVRGIVLWLDSVSETSFSSDQQDDGVPITVWNDINPQSIKNTFNATVNAPTSPATFSSDILYKDGGINGLPVVNFAGTAGAYFSLGAPIVTTYNKFSYFIVYKNTDTATTATRTLFTNGVSGTNGFGYQKLTSTGNRVQLIGSTTSNTSTVMGTDPEIVSAVYDGTVLEFWRNGANKISATKAIVTPGTNFIVGAGAAASSGNAPWMGYIAELVVMDGAIKDSDRYEVEKYLSKKWGIPVTTQTP